MRSVLITLMVLSSVACSAASAQIKTYFSQKCEDRQAIGCYSEALGEGFQIGMVGLGRVNSGFSTAVGGMFQGRTLPGATSGTSWGVATEAWNGDFDVVPETSITLVGGEFAVAAQYHANEAPLVGVDVVYKNRQDGADRPTYGLVGENKYNNHSWGIMISAQPRSAIGEYSGWETAIRIAPNSLDRSATEPETTIIDMGSSAVDNNGGNPWMFRWMDPDGTWMGFKYNSKTKAVEFWRDIKGHPKMTAAIPMR